MTDEKFRRARDIKLQLESLDKLGYVMEAPYLVLKKTGFGPFKKIILHAFWNTDVYLKDVGEETEKEIREAINKILERRTKELRDELEKL